MWFFANKPWWKDKKRDGKKLVVLKIFLRNQENMQTKVNFQLL